MYIYIYIKKYIYTSKRKSSSFKVCAFTPANISLGATHFGACNWTFPSYEGYYDKWTIQELKDFITNELSMEVPATIRMISFCIQCVVGLVKDKTRAENRTFRMFSLNVSCGRQLVVLLCVGKHFPARGNVKCPWW